MTLDNTLVVHPNLTCPLIWGEEGVKGSVGEGSETIVAQNRAPRLI